MVENKRKSMLIGLLLGVLYGLMIRIVAEFDPAGIFEIISHAFLWVTPVSVGAIAVYFSYDGSKIPVGRQFGISALAMLFFLIAMFVLFLEGLICIVLILPVFMIASCVGGLIMGVVLNRWKSKAKHTLNTLVLLPVLLNPLEANFINKIPSTGVIETSIVVNAVPQAIFDELSTVKEINPSELGFSLMHFIGLPRPLEASMDGEGVDAVRLSKWEKGVSFKERITQWDPPQRMYYEFDIPKGSIPREALDRHVELGGDYFTVLSGGYEIDVIDSTSSRLTLRTVYENKSHLKLYGKMWASFVFHDFHRSLLSLMKRRSERQDI